MALKHEWPLNRLLYSIRVMTHDLTAKWPQKISGCSKWLPLKRSFTVGKMDLKNHSPLKYRAVTNNI